MKKQNIINLVKYHMENNDDAFRAEVYAIAKEFDEIGEESISEYLMDLISTTNYYMPQISYKNFNYLKKTVFRNTPLLLPEPIKDDVLGLVRAINKKMGINKILFYGRPGSGKTESAYQISRLLNRELLTVDFEQLIDSRLGQTAKNISSLFDEIKRVQPLNVIILFDEIDAIVLDRINKNDIREMGRVTSTFLREIDSINEDVTIIATTNLFESFDKALIRRFDSIISFNRYSHQDLMEIADSLLANFLKKVDGAKQNKRLFHKILNNVSEIPYPGELMQIIKTSIAFSDVDNEFDYLRKLYLSFNDHSDADIQFLKKQGYTTREIEILTNIPKSSVSRKLRDGKIDE